MPVVTNIKWLPVFQAYEHDHDGVEQGDSQHQQWDQDRGESLAFAGKVKGGEDADDRQAVAQEVASAVSHEDFSRGAVMEQEAQGGAAGGGGEHGDKVLLPDRCNQQQIHGGNHCRSPGQTIHVVKEIQGIDDRHDPEHGDNPADELVADSQRQARPKWL